VNDQFLNEHEITDRINAAYRKLAARPGDFVSIADLTDLADVHVSDLTAMLIWLYEDQQVNLIPRSNQRALTDRERQATIWCGGEYKHLLSIRKPRAPMLGRSHALSGAVALAALELLACHDTASSSLITHIQPVISAGS
jgi:hypothetical protein